MTGCLFDVPQNKYQSYYKYMISKLEKWDPQGAEAASDFCLFVKNDNKVTAEKLNEVIAKTKCLPLTHSVTLTHHCLLKLVLDCMRSWSV